MKKIFGKPIPYTLAAFSSIVTWAILSASFGYCLILSQARFDLTGTKLIFVIGVPFYLIFAASLSSIEYGILRIFGLKEKRQDLRILNDYIVDRKIKSNISDENLQFVFYSLIKRRDDWLHAAKYALIVVFLASLAEWYFSGVFVNISAIFIGGLICIFLMAVFSSFFTERFIFPVLTQCRKLIFERKIKIKEPASKFYNLKAKFSFFLLLPILVVLVVLIFVAPFDVNIVILSLIGLFMSIIISRVLSFTIYRSFNQIKIFAEEIPKTERTFFVTGSLESEIIDLSESLNKASYEVYSSNKQEEKAKDELKERVVELEKIIKMTVGRELKMIELKKEIEKLQKR